jgi:acetyl/propionyl-CoA carboxylase alpha subunit
VRFDSGIEEGSEVTTFYDPLLAKLVTWGVDREASLARMRTALAETVVLGVATNLGRLQAIVAHEAFRAGAFDTGFLDSNPGIGVAPPALDPEGLAAVARALRGTTVRKGSPASDPFASLGPWRLGA